MSEIIHVFNSSIVSGPETLVIPALKNLSEPVSVIFLKESRRSTEAEGPIAYAKSIGIETHEVTVRSRVDRSAIHDLASLIRRLNPSIVHAHDVKASTYLIQAVQKIPEDQRRFKTFSTHHGVRGRSGWKSKLYERFYSYWVLPRFDRVLTVCTSDSKILASRGLSRSKLRVHLNGVDRRLVEPSKREEESRAIRESWNLEQLGIDPKTVVIGFVGRIAPEKRLDRVFQILKLTHRKDPQAKWSLLIFGRGPLEAELKTMGLSVGLKDRVFWMGYRSGVGNELAGLDILISMSDAEGLPINLVEAAWAGTPVFATAVDGNLDLIRSEKEGLLVAPEMPDSIFADKLLTLIRDEALRRQVGASFQDRVRTEFSGTKWVRQLEAYYNEARSQSLEN